MNDEEEPQQSQEVSSLSKLASKLRERKLEEEKRHEKLLDVSKLISDSDSFGIEKKNETFESWSSSIP